MARVQVSRNCHGLATHVLTLSPGAIVNLALYGRGMRVDEVYEMFKELSRQIFRRQNRWSCLTAAAPRITAAAQLFASCRNGRFPARNIDGPLRDVFGDVSMLDHPYMNTIGARTGFPIVDWNTLETYVVTSYNRIAFDDQKKTSKHKSCDSRHRPLYARGPDDQILVKDALVFALLSASSCC